MNPLLDIRVERYLPEGGGEPIITVAFAEQTPLGTAGFVYPLSPDEVRLLIEKLQKAVQPRTQEA
jgi:hypothetical protein